MGCIILTDINTEEKTSETLPKRYYDAGQIFVDYGGFIREIIKLKLEDEHEREDVFQNFFTSLIKKPIPNNKDLNNEEKLKSYLYKAVINDIIDYVRIRNKYNNVVKQLTNEVGTREYCPGPDEQLEVSEEAYKMLALIEEKLSESEYEALKLRFNHQLDNKSIAKKMEVKQDSVYRYISNGLKRIREFISKEGSDD